MENTYYVYAHKDKSGNIFYIGMGKKNRAFNKCNRSSTWVEHVKKHGLVVEIMFQNLSKEDAYRIEVELIEKYGRKDLNNGVLVNLTAGGDGSKSSSKTGKMRKVNRYTLQGEYIDSFNSIASAMRETGVLDESIRYACGYKHRSAGGFLWRDSNSRVALKYEPKKGRFTEVSSYDLNGNRIKTFPSLKKCADYYDTKYQFIRASIIGVLRGHKNMLFAYGAKKKVKPLPEKIYSATKLSKSQVVKILNYKGKKSAIELSIKFSVNKQTIYDIWNGKTWNRTT